MAKVHVDNPVLTTARNVPGTVFVCGECEHKTLAVGDHHGKCPACGRLFELDGFITENADDAPRAHDHNGENQTMTGLDYRHGKSKNAASISYRMMTAAEARTLWASHAPARDQNGNIRMVKINGKVRTWKRDPSRVEVPCKYGMYDYFTDTAVDGVMQSLVVIEN